MKKFLISFALFLYLLPAHVLAQDKDSVVTLPEVVVTSKWMVNEKVDDAFNARFPNADDVVWRRLNKDYLTKFIETDLKHQALFRKNGSMKYDIIYMGESHLPKELLESVRTAYSAYEIDNAARIERGGQIFWIINLQGIRQYVVLRSEDGDLSEVRRIEKADPQK